MRRNPERLLDSARLDRKRQVAPRDRAVPVFLRLHPAEATGCRENARRRRKISRGCGGAAGRPPIPDTHSAIVVSTQARTTTQPVTNWDRLRSVAARLEPLATRYP